MKRQQIWRNTSGFVDKLLRSIENLPHVDQLMVIRELNWRLETAMVPLFGQWMAPLVGAVEEVFRQLASGKLELISASAEFAPAKGESQTLDAWCEVAFSLLRDARESYDQGQWNTIKGLIEKVDEHQRYVDRLHYETALWALWNVDRGSAQRILQSWVPQSPLAAMRRAGLLAEIDETLEAQSALRLALAEIRRALRDQGQSRELLSTEGWCMYLLRAVERSLDLFDHSNPKDEIWDRWEELKAWDCSPWPYMEFFDNVLSGPPPRLPQRLEEKRGFDPGHVTRSIHFGAAFDGFLPGYAYIRLCETAGVPVRLPFVNMTGDRLKHACRWIQPLTPFWSPALLIRAAKLDDLTDGEFLMRTRVVQMDAALARRLNSWCAAIVSREIAPESVLNTRARSREQLLAVCAEVISRLAFMLDASGLKESFSLVLRSIRFPSAASDANLHERCLNWFRRLFEAAGPELLIDWLPDLIRELPLSGNLHPGLQLEQSWPDPIKEYPFERLAAVGIPETQMHRISESISWLLNRTHTEVGAQRRWMLLRLMLLNHIRMSPEQRTQMGELLWTRRTHDGIPDIAGLFVPALLDLPAPDDVDAKGIVKAHVLRLTPTGVISRDERGRIVGSFHAGTSTFLGGAANASKPLISVRDGDDRRIDWTQSEAQELFEKGLLLWNSEKTAANYIQDDVLGIWGSVKQNLTPMAAFLLRTVLPRVNFRDEAEWAKLSRLLQETREAGIFLTEVLPYTLLHRPEDATIAEDAIKHDLEGDIEVSVRAAANALQHWCRLATAHKVAPAGGTALLSLIRRVVFRRRTAIVSCIRAVALLAAELPQVFEASHMDLVLPSLVAWREAAAIPNENGGAGEFPEAERPEIQAALVMLAGALDRWCSGRGPRTIDKKPVTLWLELAKSSPLPEVRYALGHLPPIEGKSACAREATGCASQDGTSAQTDPVLNA